MEKIICTNCGADNEPSAKHCNQCGHDLSISKEETPAAQTSAQGKRSKLIGSVVGIIAFGIAYWGVQQLFFKQPSFDKVMVQVASEINATCPIMVDEETRLDNTLALPDNSFQYNYTLLHLTKAEISVDTIIKYVEPGIIANVRTNPDMDFFRKNKVTMIYYYKDMNGEFVHKLSITPAMYEH